MVTVTYPWSIRSGNHNNTTNAGVFTFNNAGEGGSVSINISFRQVLDYKGKRFL